MKKKKKGWILVFFLIYAILVLIILVVAFWVRKQERLEMDETLSVSDNLPTIDGNLPLPSPSLSATNFWTRTTGQTPIASPSQTPTFTETATSTPTITTEVPYTATPSQSNTPSLTGTSTPNPGLVWAGSWIGYFGEEIGSIYEMEIEITVEGNQVKASANFQGSPMIFNGRFSDDFRLVTGTWSDPPVSGEFTWYLQSDGQFVGNRDEVFAYCGSRDEQPIPDPCYGP